MRCRQVPALSAGVSPPAEGESLGLRPETPAHRSCFVGAHLGVYAHWGTTGSRGSVGTSLWERLQSRCSGARASRLKPLPQCASCVTASTSPRSRWAVLSGAIGYRHGAATSLWE
jgi:hypothetical protein